MKTQTHNAHTESRPGDMGTCLVSTGRLSLCAERGVEMEEEWRVVAGFPDYAVSDLGRVKRIADYPHSRKGRLLKPFANEKGYLMVGLMLNRIKKTRKVHLLVAGEFLEPCPPGMECNHVNGNKEKNRHDNLEWITHKKNVQNAWAMDLCPVLRGERNGHALLTDESVRDIKRMLAAGIKLQTEIAISYHVHPATINAIKKGRNWAHIECP